MSSSHLPKVRSKRPSITAPVPPPRRYDQARQAVEEYLRKANHKPGDRLPTEEAMCRELGCSRVTIARALNELAWQGRLRRVQGSGTYIAEPRTAEVTPAQSGSSPLRLLVGAIPFSTQDDYCAPLFAGVREEAAAQGVDIVYHMRGVADGGAVPDAETVQKLQAQAVLTLAWRIDDLPRVLSLHEAGIPVVAMGLRSRAHHLPLVSTDNFEGMRAAVRHLQEAGHRRIAYTTINIQNSDVLERLSGFQFQMAQCACPVDPMYLQVSHWRREPSFLEAWWHSMNPKPTALILDGTDAPALLVVLAREGVRIPDELSIVLIDEIQAVRYFTPRLTVLRQPTYDMGRQGLAKLAAMLRGEDDGAPKILPTELIIGDSVRNIAAPSTDVGEGSTP